MLCVECFLRRSVSRLGGAVRRPATVKPRVAFDKLRQWLSSYNYFLNDKKATVSY